METATKAKIRRNELLMLSLELLYARVESLRNLSYELQSNILNAEFELETTGRELFMLFEPTISEEILDLQLNKNITNEGSNT